MEGNSGLPVDFLNENRLSGYTLTSASPCIGAGADAANNGGLDFRGKVLMSPSDIGAYEFDATAEHICNMCPVCGLCTCESCVCGHEACTHQNAPYGLRCVREVPDALYPWHLFQPSGHDSGHSLVCESHKAHKSFSPHGVNNARRPAGSRRASPHNVGDTESFCGCSKE